MTSTKQLDQIQKSLCVVRSSEFQDCYPWFEEFKHRISKRMASHFSATGRISLQVVDCRNREQNKPVMPCEWLERGETSLAVCRNPYPTQADDRWLLCQAEGTACFAGPTPETARIYFYFITDSLQVGKTMNDDNR